MLVWIILVIVGLLEIVWAIGLKYTKGFTLFFPSLITLIAMAASMYLLGLATKTLPIGTAYAVWVGIGVVGSSILGVILFKEPANWLKVIFILLLIISILGLKMFGNKS